MQSRDYEPNTCSSRQSLMLVIHQGCFGQCAGATAPRTATHPRTRAFEATASVCGAIKPCCGSGGLEKAKPKRCFTLFFPRLSNNSVARYHKRAVIERVGRNGRFVSCSTTTTVQLVHGHDAGGAKTAGGKVSRQTCFHFSNGNGGSRPWELARGEDRKKSELFLLIVILFGTSQHPPVPSKSGPRQQ